MCLNEDDIDSFGNDPVEFVHKQNSPLTDFYDPRMSTIKLVTDLVKHRGQDVTQNLLGRMKEILQQYAAAPVEQKNHIEIDSALLVFGSLAKYLLAKDKYANESEGLLVTSAFPEFNSPISFLRYRACWMVHARMDNHVHHVDFPVPTLLAGGGEGFNNLLIKDILQNTRLVIYYLQWFQGRSIITMYGFD